MGRVTALMSSVMDLHVRIALQEVGKEKRRVIGGGIFLAMGVGLASMASLALQLALILWIRERFLSHEGPLEKVVVHGHTIFDRVMDCGNRIGIDTGAFRSGVLTALVLEGDQRRIIQACSVSGGPVEIFHGDRAR